LNKTPIEYPPDTLSVEADPLCPHCDYNLRELRETRCPECGESFTWDAARAHAQEQQAFHFEFQARRQPVTSMLRTTLALVRPRRFWRAFPENASVRLKALLVQFCVLLVVIECLYVLALTLVSSVEMWAWGGTWRFSTRELMGWAGAVCGQAMPAIICAGFMYLLLFVLLRLFQHRRIEYWRLFRVMAYSGMTMLLYATSTTILSRLIGIIEDYYFSPLQLIHPPHLSSFAAVISLVLTIRFGIEHELNVSRPWLITLSALLLTAVAIHALILGSGLVIGTYEWGENPITTWFTYVMDPFWFMNLW